MYIYIYICIYREREMCVFHGGFAPVGRLCDKRPGSFLATTNRAAAEVYTNNYYQLLIATNNYS